MRKATIWGVVLICAVLVFTGVQAQRIITGGSDGAVSGVEPVPVWVVAGEMEVKAVKGPVQVFGTVDVGNFPDPQNVAGTVNVGNYPAVQDVAGTVSVSNLPLDANGNVRVSAVLMSSPTARLLADGGL